MSITQHQFKQVSLIICTITNTHKFQLSLIAFRNTNYHVVHQSTIQAMICMTLLWIIGHHLVILLENDMAVFHRHIDSRVDLLT